MHDFETTKPFWQALIPGYASNTVAYKSYLLLIQSDFSLQQFKFSMLCVVLYVGKCITKSLPHTGTLTVTINGPSYWHLHIPEENSRDIDPLPTTMMQHVDYLSTWWMFKPLACTNCLYIFWWSSCRRNLHTKTGRGSSLLCMGSIQSCMQ